VLALIASLYNQIIFLFRILSGIVVVVIFGLIVTDVSVRMMGISPWTYSSGVVEYGLLWFTMLAAPWLARIKGHVFIDAVKVMLPPGVQTVVAKIVYLICIVSSLVFAYYASTLLVEAVRLGQMDVRGEEMPLWTLLLPIPVGFTMVAIEFIRYLLGFDDMYAAAEKETV
jgi:C4-dicarboxylate transporter DctQ subunit